MKNTEEFARWLEACSPQRVSIGNTKKEEASASLTWINHFCVDEKIEAIHKKTVLIIALTRV